LSLHNVLALLININLIIFSVSCIGTVATTKIEKTKTIPAEVDILEFKGLERVIPTSHSQVELYFKSVSSKSKDITYKIFINNSRFPIHLSSQSLNINQQGYLIYTVKNLQVNTKYAFSVSVIDKESSRESSKGETLFATTFMDFTSNFAGVNSLELPKGKRAKDSVIISWVPVDTIGTLYAKNRDVVGYELTYTYGADAIKIMNDSSYYGEDKVTLLDLDSLSELPMIAKERSREVNGLSPGTEYFFRVRAIHAGYNKFSDTVTGYKSEENNIILSIKTEENRGSFYFEESTIELVKPLGEKALSNHDIKWKAASGDFDHYKLIVHKIDSLDTVDKITTKFIDEVIENPSMYLRVESGEDSAVIKNLESYRPYQLKLIVCETPQCDSSSRQESELKRFDTFPELAPFEGISSIDSPLNFPDVALSRIHINFTPPSTNLGYLTDLQFYCYSSKDDQNPVKLDFNTVSDLPEEEGCNGLKLVVWNNADNRYMPMPESQEEYFRFSRVSIEGALPGKQYCFSGGVEIDGVNDYGFEDIRNVTDANVKCIIPEVKVPSIVQFSGRKDSCIIDDNSLGITWEKPSGGIYKFFSVFWKLKDLLHPFSFSSATNLESSYKFVDQIDENNTAIFIDNLSPGKEYVIGVLTYYVDPFTGVKKYSEFNASFSSCPLPNPKFEFQEWEEAFAIGPKGNGLSPDFRKEINKEYIVETLKNGIPTEVKMNAEILTNPDDNSVIFDYEEDAGFDGAFGAKDSISLNGLFKFSNSGIIKISWEEVTFYNGSQTLDDLVNLDEQELENENSKNKNISKTERRSGYKVYRSIDNRLSWVELTSESYSFQNPLNAGYILATPTNWKPRVNAPAISRRIASFIDYSVSAITAKNHEATETARVYWYKVVPYLNDIQLISDDRDHMIKVVLPPPNMALVNRKMANKAFCNSIGMIWDNGQYIDKKPILKDESSHYACYFNGVGASGLDRPWVAGKTVYDIGGDMLVDRFGLGCNFSRGGLDKSDSNYDTAKGLENFKGKNDSGSDLIGCTGKGSFELDEDSCRIDKSYGYLPFNTVPENDSSCENLKDKNNKTLSMDLSDESWSRLRPGDCVGNSNFKMSYFQCSPEDKKDNPYRTFSFPGAHGGVLEDCDDKTSHTYFGIPSGQDIMRYPGFKFDKMVAQSSPGTVFYDQKNIEASQSTIMHLHANLTIESDEPDTFLLYRSFALSQCAINLSAEKTTNPNNTVARWVYLNGILEEDGLTYSDIPLGTLYDKSLSDLEKINSLYGDSLQMPDVSSFRSPSFMETPLLRLMVSNDAKLPFVSKLKKESFHKACSMFSVNVGYELDNGEFVEVKKEKSKEISTRKETIAFSTWPSTFDESMIDGITSGSNCENNDDGECIKYENYGSGDGNNSCNINNRRNEFQFVVSYLFNGSLLNSRFGSVYNIQTITGSSPLDNQVSDGLYSSTQNCMSKYGIQDTLGNYENYLSDEVYCDPSGETLMLGVENNPFLSLPFGSHYERLYSRDLVAWSQPSPGTGRCSFVAVGEDSDLKYRSGSRFNSIFELGGNEVNTDIIKRYKFYDQESVNDMRNGNGQFLTFGQRNIAPPLSKENNISFIGNSKVKFFAPAVGITLSCIDNGCEYENNDNQVITTSSLIDNITDSNELEKIEINNFPIGASIIQNESMADISDSTDYPLGFNRWPNEDDIMFQYIDSIDLVDYPPDLELSSMIYLVAGLDSNAEVIADFAYWTTPREDQYDLNGNILYEANVLPGSLPEPKTQIKLLMIGGGDYKKQQVGIYSLKLVGNDVPDLSYFKSDVVARCSVILDE